MAQAIDVPKIKENPVRITLVHCTDTICHNHYIFYRLEDWQNRDIESALRAKNAKLKWALRTLVNIEDFEYCPYCSRWVREESGHSDNCPWAAAGKLLEEE